MADDLEVSEEALDAGRLAAMNDREKRVEAALRSGKAVEATKIALENPPFSSKNQAIKDKNTTIVMKALVTLGQKDADVGAFMESLDADLADNLMKYLYRGLLKPDNSGLLLKIHAQLVEKGGVGCIVRAITDRKTA